MYTEVEVEFKKNLGTEEYIDRVAGKTSSTHMDTYTTLGATQEVPSRQLEEQVLGAQKMQRPW